MGQLTGPAEGISAEVYHQTSSAHVSLCDSLVISGCQCKRANAGAAVVLRATSPFVYGNHADVSFQSRFGLSDTHGRNAFPTQDKRAGLAAAADEYASWDTVSGPIAGAAVAFFVDDTCPAAVIHQKRATAVTARASESTSRVSTTSAAECE